MAEYVIVPKADWQSALDATREKTGKKDGILASQLAGEIRSISGGGGTTEKEILPETTITLATSDDTVREDSQFSYYPIEGEPVYTAIKTLVADETYQVVWGDTEYSCVAVDVSDTLADSFPEGSVINRFVALGNMALLGGEDTEEPFIITDMDVIFEGNAIIDTSVMTVPGITESSYEETVRIYQKVSGGGSVEGVHYVTFMNHDGTVEAGKLPVAEGYDCPVPKFDAPVKESDVQYDYTFVGWATTPNGELDENALANVTEDRTVYAAYSASLRVYTITYYDDDGVTVLKTEQLVYGDTPSYAPEKSGYVFDCWEPELADVTGDANYIAVWSKQITFAGGTWADIAAICEAGDAAKYFAIGDKRTITLTARSGNTPMDVVFEIVGINHDNLEDGTKAGISVVSQTALNLNQINYASNDGLPNGWSGSTLRTALDGFRNNNILPSDLVPHIKPVVKKSVDSTKAALEETVDKIWLPSVTEFGKTYSYTLNGQGSAYTFKSGITAHRHDKTGVLTNYDAHITRSKYTGGSNFTCTIGGNGSVSYSNEKYGRVGFCI